MGVTQEETHYGKKAMASHVSDSASVRCTGLKVILGDLTSQLTGLKASASNLFVPDTTAYLQRSCGVKTHQAS